MKVLLRHRTSLLELLLPDIRLMTLEKYTLLLTWKVQLKCFQILSAFKAYYCDKLITFAWLIQFSI